MDYSVLRVTIADYERLFEEALKAGATRDYGRATDLLLTIVSETDTIPQAYLYLGRSYHALGAYDKAIRYLRYFTDVKPDLSAGFFFLGRSYLANNRADHAIVQLRRALAIEQDNPQIIGLLGMAYLRAKRPEYALENLSRAVELEPDSKTLYSAYLNSLLVEAIRQFRRGGRDLPRQMFEFFLQNGQETLLPHLYLSTIYKELKDYSAAILHLGKAIGFSPGDSVLQFQYVDLLVRAGRHESANEALRNLGLFQSEEQESMAPDELLRILATESFQNKKFRRAAEHAKQFIKLYGPDYDMHVLLGEVCREFSQHERATNHYSRAIKLDGHRLEPHYGILLSLWQQMQWKELQIQIERIQRIDPEDEIASYYESLCACKLNRPLDEAISGLMRELEKTKSDPYLITALAEQHLRNRQEDLAIRWFEGAIAVSNNHKEAYEGLADAYERLEINENIIETYERFLHIFPQETEVRKKLISKLVETGRFKDAIEHLNVVIPANRSNEGLLRLLAFCNRQDNRFRDAAVIYRNLLKQNPSSEHYLRALSFCLERAGKSDASLELLQKAFEFVSPSPSLRLILGVLLFRKGDLDEALKVFRIVLDESPDDWRACKNIGLIYRKRGIMDMADRYLDRADILRDA